MSGETEFRVFWRAVALSLVFACLCIRVSPASAQEDAESTVQQPDADASAADAPTTDVSTADSDAQKESELRQQSAMAGLLVLALLCIVFLTLIVWVVLWARRMRRLTSQPLPKQHPGDPLWYLRKSPAESDQSD